MEYSINFTILVIFIEGLFFLRQNPEKKEGNLFGIQLCSLSLLSQKMERRIDVLIGSVGTDGARTRNVRLDRAVLLPIELQSQGNKKRSSRNFGFFFILSYQVYFLRTSKNKSVLPSDSRLTNCWAELDLNQRRHIANEFTVRPH